MSSGWWPVECREGCYLVSATLDVQFYFIVMLNDLSNCLLSLPVADVWKFIYGMVMLSKIFEFWNDGLRLPTSVYVILKLSIFLMQAFVLSIFPQLKFEFVCFLFVLLLPCFLSTSTHAEVGYRFLIIPLFLSTWQRWPGYSDI